MCGIAGFIHPQQTEALEHLRRMGGRLTHRGPDDSGEWHDPESGVGLAHRRLAIQDVSEQGHQPMVSASGRYVIVYNGEVYNFQEIRRRLEEATTGTGYPVTWRGHSDTEVILEAIEQWGLLGVIHQFVGMFAFALWDKVEGRLHLVRDRIGIKPLYYGWQNGAFVFGSELKALREFPGFENRVNRDALALLMRHNYIPAPHSIYEGIHKLLPGTVLTVNPMARGTLPPPEPYWSLKQVARQGLENRFQGTDTEAVDQLEALLKEAVELRMIADVPLGAFLSGGIDSSLVVALMQAQSERPVKTFSIGFGEADYNEAVYAKAVAKHLGTDHTELYVSPEMALKVVPLLPELYDEPFADSSQIPTFLVSQLTRGHVTVSLSGDGGDELFAGYNRYFLGRKLRATAGRLPLPLRAFLAEKIGAVQPDTWNRLAQRWIGRLAPRWRQAKPGYLMRKLADFLPFEGWESFYERLVSLWNEPEKLVIGAVEPPTVFNQKIPWERRPDFIHWMLFLDTLSSLPEDILTKVDRASMAVGLEARVPLLDHRVAEFAWRLPLEWKVRHGEGKWILKQVLHRHLPRQLVDRPKMGFGVPVGEWLKGPLKDWAEDLLDASRMRGEGYLDPGPVRALWQEHKDGRCNWQYQLWNVLMFQSWLRHGGGG